MSPTPSASIGASEGTLRVLTFVGHVEYGGMSSRANWVAPFESETGCRVATLDRVTTSEEMAAKFAANAYDVVSPSPELAGLLTARGSVAPVDTSLIEGYGDIPERLRELPALRRGDRVYGIPYLWGINRIIGPRDGDDGPAGLYATGPAAIRNSPLSIADAALVLKRTQPALGIGDPFRLTPAQLDAAEKLLAAQDGPGRIYWSDPVEVIRAVAGGSVRLAQAWPYHEDLFERAGRPVRAVEAAETTGWADSWMLAAEPASPNCAYKWLNWVVSERTQQRASAWTGLAPANPEGCTGHARPICDRHHLGDDKWLDRVFFAVRPSRDCGGQDGECTDYDDWVNRWKKLVS
ncbi:ABC transporter substrate-binding protein [Planobispora takensis]|uniref:Spermidine/putrescine ABC transporter substrate-binding protein n=1 Tax=Planobispora takensis TaxID=1367882 RepID=A0A8J3SU25_9ACTN|nr:ABC transporter substrate-binding protein [Planobispora takensis]GIH98847.1 spermidine/putrescine ABC transporter substrate-binding protein [Planobispora takensis]